LGGAVSKGVGISLFSMIARVGDCPYAIACVNDGLLLSVFYPESWIQE
jgi:hypothetical protein